MGLDGRYVGISSCNLNTVSSKFLPSSLISLRRISIYEDHHCLDDPAVRGNLTCSVRDNIDCEFVISGVSSSHPGRVASSIRRRCYDRSVEPPRLGLVPSRRNVEPGTIV